MNTEKAEGARTRRKRTPRREIVEHLAWWWMSDMTPWLYATMHGIEPATFERWIRVRLIFRPEAGGSRSARKSSQAGRGAFAGFVPMVVVGDDADREGASW